MLRHKNPHYFITLSKLSHGTTGYLLLHLLTGDNTFYSSYLTGMFWGSTQTSKNVMNPGKCATVGRHYGQCHLHRERHGTKYHSTDS